MNLWLIKILDLLCIATMLTFPLAPSIYGQAVTSARESTPAGEVLLCVGGEVGHPLKLTAVDLSKLPRRR